MQCGLCKAQKETYRLIEENEDAFSIVPTSHLKLGHIMILPKSYVINLSEMDERELKNIFLLVDKLNEIVKNLSNQDTIVHINTGKHKSQEHFHMHIVPTKGNLRELIAIQEGVPKRKEISKEKMEEMKNTISSHVNPIP